MFQKKYKAGYDRLRVDHDLEKRVKTAMADAAAEPQRPSFVPEKKRGASFWITRVGIPLTAGVLVVVLAAGVFLSAMRSSVSRDTGELKTCAAYEDLYREIRKSGLKAGRVYGTAGNDKDIVMRSGKGDAPVLQSVEYSGTNVQVAGVDEADAVKTDGEYIYMLSGNSVRILRADGAKTRLVSTFPFCDSQDPVSGNMYLSGERLAVLWNKTINETIIRIFDISDRSAPVQIRELSQSGCYITSRMTDGILYTVSAYTVDADAMEKDRYESYVPRVSRDGEASCIPCGDIASCLGPDFSRQSTYEVITSCRLEDARDFLSVKSVLGRAAEVYMSRNNLYLCMYGGFTETEKAASDFSTIVKFSADQGKLEQTASARINGRVLNSFSMDEYRGCFRIAVTENKYRIEKKIALDSVIPEFYDTNELLSTANSVIILDEGLQETGKISDLAKGESVYAVRFQGDVGYVVTFYQTDPLFELDLRDPKAPRVTDALEIEGVSTYLHSFGDHLLLGLGIEGNQSGLTGEMKLSMFRVNAEGKNEEIDKYVLPAGSISEALYNHKALLIDPAKGMIAFPAQLMSGNAYLLFSYTKEGFVLKRSFLEKGSLEEQSNNARGLYINDVLYVIFSDSGVIACDLDSGETLRQLNF